MNPQTIIGRSIVYPNILRVPFILNGKTIYIHNTQIHKLEKSICLICYKEFLKFKSRSVSRRGVASGNNYRRKACLTCSKKCSLKYNLINCNKQNNIRKMKGVRK